MKAFALAATLAAPAAAEHWAVIMAGSNTYGNYRHQADACHAYQIAKKNGIPESNIILLAYDDIANSSRNPFPGKIFNKPTSPGTPGKDVYAGCKIDYRGKEVTGENFIKVLSGDSSAPGPVLKSKSSDHVFVYYADHGGPGILGVPTGASGGFIHAADINKAIETLHSKGGYKEFLFYLEACESGSIFQNLLKAPNAKAVTAASPKQSSYGWYCPGSATGGDLVDGKNIGSCLGDEFSVRWMEDTDSANINSETVGAQVAKVKKLVTKSEVQEYGVTSFDSEPIGNFEGNDGQMNGSNDVEMEGHGVDSRDVEVHQAYHAIKRANTVQERKVAETELARILARRQAADTKFGAIALFAMNGNKAEAEAVLEGDVQALTHATVTCHQAALKSVVKECGSFNDYSLRYSRLFANLCAREMDQKTIESSIKSGCSQEPQDEKSSCLQEHYNCHEFHYNNPCCEGLRCVVPSGNRRSGEGTCLGSTILANRSEEPLSNTTLIV
jgi:legumain